MIDSRKFELHECFLVNQARENDSNYQSISHYIYASFISRRSL